jgi:hypothetical protein
MTLVVLIITAVMISGYYFLADSYSAVKNIPTSIYVAAIVYILIQLVKRNIRKRMEWFDWFYYIGLLAIALPFLMPSKAWLFNAVVYGTLSLILPPLIELIVFVKRKR